MEGQTIYNDKKIFFKWSAEHYILNNVNKTNPKTRIMLLKDNRLPTLVSPVVVTHVTIPMTNHIR